ncbi:MAG: hypothetical protein L0211_23350 [Planctomycetaceae bacterium]|nr:hypothetical protein [Planctomycetaceae bacterium]
MTNRGAWAWLCLAAIIACSAGADDEQEAEAAKRFQPYAKETAAKYELKTAGDEPRKLTRREESLLRWTNPLGGNKAHGELFLWTDRGRPAAVLSMYEYTDAAGVVHEHHEWASLSLRPIQAAGPREWSPAAAGIELKPVPEAPLPADTPLRRLRQMRDLGAGFTAEKTSRQNVTRELRLLSQPTFRYETGDPELVDGALFALVEATDPEIFLCLEARLLEGKPTWHYGLARMNSLPMAVSYKGKQVWVAELLAARDTYDRKDLPYTALRIK